jgi:8-amino-7-oxononanoate synthase
VYVLIGMLSKALGSYSAFACSTPAVAELLLNRARTLIFSPGLPAPCVEAARMALHTLHSEPELVDRLHRTRSPCETSCHTEGSPCLGLRCRVVPLVIGDARAAMALCEGALRMGVFAQAIRLPTVLEGTSRPRLVAMATHTEDQLRCAARALTAVSGGPSGLDVGPARWPVDSA